MKLKEIFILLFFVLLGSSTVTATHIVGGSLTYEHLGGASYRITYKMYRDCDPSSIDFPATLQIAVYTGNNPTSLYSIINIPRPPQNQLDPPIDTCAFDPGICVSEAIYTTVVNNFYPGSGGYHLVYQLCCRNFSINNINNPGGTGSSSHTYIPDNSTVLTNSSPLWVNFPPVYVCANNPLEFNHSATDPDGDSLVYSLYRPFDDGGYTWGGAYGVAPSWPNFNQVLYNAGYSFTSPLEPSAPAQTLEIDPQTGLLDFAAGATPVIGQHVVGVKVEEYRNGQLLNTVFRDFQFNVINCPPPVVAEIGPVDPCSGTAIDMINNSTGGGSSYQWDFGDGSPTSNQFEPTHTYSGIGQYTITLIIDPGTNCSDTTTRVIDISWTNSDFNYTDSTCVNDPVSFSDATTTAANGNPNQWMWDFGDGMGTSTLPNPSYTYTTPGDYIVQLISISDAGCADTITYPMYVQGIPDVQVGPDTTACINNPLITLNGSVTNASGGLWIGQGGSFSPNSSDLNANYNPSAGEIAAGQSMLILSSTGNGFCPAGTDTLFIDYVNGPTVDAGADVSVCNDTTEVPLSGSVQIAGGGQWTSSGGGSFSPTDDDLNASYIPTPADTANGSVTIYLTSTNNANCVAAVDSMIITFFDPPTMSILGEDTICTGDPVVLDGNTTTGAGYWETFGTGTFNPGDSLVNSTYVTSPGDDASGSVTLVFHTLNNGGCQQLHDTLVVDIIEAPTPSFTFTDVCLNEVTDFTNASTSVDPISGYEWDFGDGFGDNTSDPSHTFGSPGTQSVTLIVFSNNGCSDTLTQQVPVHYLPEVGFYNSTPCLNGGSQFIDTTFAQDTNIVAWSWNFGDGQTNTDQDPLNVYANSGVYTVTLVATTAFGCVDSATQTSNVLPGPSANFIADNYSVNMFQQVNFTDQSTPAANITDWEWDFGDGMGSSINQNPSYAFDSSSTYSVLLVVTDINGCMDTVYKDIVVVMPPVIPSGFTPNGDGNNDILYVLGGPYKELDFLIYNNWGELIFESHDQMNGWDGTYKGVEQPIGVFVYTVRAVTEDDEVHELSGDVTLLR